MLLGPSLLGGGPDSYSIRFTEMPETPIAVMEWINEVVGDYEVDECCEVVAGLEKVGGFMGNEAGDAGPKQNRASAHTMFAFGENFGILRCALASVGFDRGDANYHDVVPQQWQKTCGVKRLKGEKKPAFKTRLLDRAHELFPRTKFTKATCDAALIAWHLKQIYTGGTT